MITWLLATHSNCSQEEYEYSTNDPSTATVSEIGANDNGKNHSNAHVCILCDKFFNSRSNLSEHKRNVHPAIFQHECAECGKRFSLADELRNHLINHTGDKLRYR